jgi:hypothetical protein
VAAVSCIASHNMQRWLVLLPAAALCQSPDCGSSMCQPALSCSSSSLSSSQSVLFLLACCLYVAWQSVV